MKRVILCLVFGAVSLATASVKADASKSQVEQTLNQFHEAASKAGAKAYFSLFAPDGVFIGTDASERWTVKEFEKYAEPHFSKGKGWTYLPKQRHVDLAPSGDIAWFDEILENASYGTCRGSGVLRRINGAWKISQYHLTIPVPNNVADKVVRLIREANHASH